MKKCAICGADSADDVQTCVNDGEASWTACAPDEANVVEVDEAPKRGPGRPKKS